MEVSRNVVLNAWKRDGLITPDDGPVKAALLLGSDVPPCATRSFPICPRETAVVTGGVLHQPYAILSRKKIDNLKKIQNYAGNHHFQEAMILAEQCMNTNNTSVHVCASLKWLEMPNGSYHGADLHEYTAEGWLWWNREWHRVPALPSEAELERNCPTYKSYPKPPNHESYVQKSSRVANMQLTGEAPMRQRMARKREENARNTLMRTGEMHLCDSVMAKIRALPKESLWSETTLIPQLIHKSRNDWKDSNAQNIPTDDLPDEQDAGISLTYTSPPIGSISEQMKPAETLTDSGENYNVSASDSAHLSAANSPFIAPTRITPDKPQDNTSDNDANGENFLASSTSDGNGKDNDKAQPKAKKQKRGAREIDDLALPGSLPLTGFDWDKTIKDMSLPSAYGLETVPQQPTRTVLRNNNEPFYAEGTGIQQVELHFVPKNMRFPNDLLMNQAAVSARALVAAVFGGDELIGQRDRKYSAPKFHTVSMVDMTVPPTTSTPVNKCISVLYFSQVEGDRSMWIEWFGTDLDYRGKNIGIGTLLLQFVLDLAIIDGGIDDIYLEVGRDKEGKMENWKAARHVYEKVGFVFMENNRIPDEVAGCCKHVSDDYYDVMRFDCKGKAPSRMSARRSTRRRIRSRLAPWSSS